MLTRERMQEVINEGFLISSKMLKDHLCDTVSFLHPMLGAFLSRHAHVHCPLCSWFCAG